jgi:LCP family protein required for cell wall assembly
LAALATSFVPGWGHLLIGRIRLGRALLIIDGFLVVIALVAILFAQIELLKAWVTPDALLAIVAINVVALVYRGVATLDAFAGGRGRGWFDWAAVSLALCIVVTPHLALGGLALSQYDLIETVFAPGEPVAASVTTTMPVPPTTAPAAVSTTVPPTTTTIPPPRIWDGKDRLNIMLLGSDAGEGRIGTRTDTIVLVSIDPKSGDVAMFSVPRNLSFAPLPEGMGLWSCNCFPDIITHLWANGEWYPEAFPGPQEPSINALKAALGLIFDVDVHYYAKVDLVGFVGLVDALGGVTIDVPETIVDPIYPHEDGGTENVVIEAGVQHLDGHLALAYSRIRRNSGDFARMHRQRCVIGALVSQTTPLDLLTRFGDIAEAIKQNVVTDIPVDRLGDFVEILPDVTSDRIASLRITRYNYGIGGDTPGQQAYDLERIKADAHLLMEDPTLALDTLDGVGLDATCEESFD